MHQSIASKVQRCNSTMDRKGLEMDEIQEIVEEYEAKSPGPEPYSSAKLAYTLWTHKPYQIIAQLEKSANPVETAKSLILQIFQRMHDEVGWEGRRHYCDWLKNVVCDEKHPENKEIMYLVSGVNRKMTENQRELEAIQKSILEFTGGHEKLQEISGANEIDGFMYKNRDDYLQKTGKTTLYKCSHCGSTNTVSQSVVSHSCSLDALIHLFVYKLPRDLQDKHILDIGSGLGSIIFAAAYLTNSTHISGVELNTEFCNLVQEITHKYGLSSRVSVVNADLREAGPLIHKTDVVVLNNPFEYFTPKETQVELWNFLKNHIKQGTTIATNPSLEKLVADLKPQLEIEVGQWVTKVKPDNDALLALYSFEPCDEDFHVYQVK